MRVTSQPLSSVVSSLAMAPTWWTGARGADQFAAHGAKRGTDPACGIAHLRERRAPGDHGRGEHAPRPARPAPACAGQYAVAADQPSEEACAVPLTKRIMDK